VLLILFWKHKGVTLETVVYIKKKGMLTTGVDLQHNNTCPHTDYLVWSVISASTPTRLSTEFLFFLYDHWKKALQWCHL